MNRVNSAAFQIAERFLAESFSRDCPQTLGLNGAEYICRRIKVERFILVDALNKVHIVSRETLICADISA